VPVLTIADYKYYKINALQRSFKDSKVLLHINLFFHDHGTGNYIIDAQERLIGF